MDLAILAAACKRGIRAPPAKGEFALDDYPCPFCAAFRDIASWWRDYSYLYFASPSPSRPLSSCVVAVVGGGDCGHLPTMISTYDAFLSTPSEKTFSKRSSLIVLGFDGSCPPL